MRQVGYTEKGSVLVELTRAEFDALVGLQVALDGQSYIDFRGMYMLDQDCPQAFQAIRAWVKGRFKLNEMREHLDKLQEALEPDQSILEGVKDGKEE